MSNFSFPISHCPGLGRASHIRTTSAATCVSSFFPLELQKEVPVKLGVSLRELVQAYVHPFLFRDMLSGFKTTVSVNCVDKNDTSFHHVDLRT